ncbi:MAG: NAD(P)/FAD-dependent oxidoreductase [Oscillochloris sp.]|nr:NAD(P)/FAD-dependent oxidoreductase [Oscillochloris sp.]
MNPKTYDMIVIGGGPGGQSAASVAADQGMRTALIERHALGGTCHNYGCDPTKTLIDVAERLHEARRAKEFGLHIPDVQVDLPAVRQRVDQALQAMRGGVAIEDAARSFEALGIDVYQADARFLSPTTLRVGNQELAFKQAIIAVGTTPMIPPIDGLREAGFMTNVEASHLPAIPKRLAVIGGGSLGIEFAQIYQRFGSHVTVLEQGERPLATEDSELADHLIKLLDQEGIGFVTQAEVVHVASHDSTRILSIRHANEREEHLEVDAILLASGRKPALENLGLELAGVEYSKSGITINPNLATSVDHIWAIGDVTGGLRFTHLAQAQGEHAARNAAAKHPEPFAPHVVPWVTFTAPALAHAGVTEDELRKRGLHYVVGRSAFSDNDRAATMGLMNGEVKILANDEGRILGGHVLGHRAGEVLAPIVVAMQSGMSVQKLAATIFPYPTLAAAVKAAAAAIYNGAHKAGA